MPILTDRGERRDVVSKFAVLEEVKVDGASFEVDAVHRLGAPRLHIDGLLLRGTGKFTARDYKAQLGSLVDESLDGLLECVGLVLATCAASKIVTGYLRRYGR